MADKVEKWFLRNANRLDPMSLLRAALAAPECNEALEELDEHKRWEADEAAFMAKNGVNYAETFVDGWQTVLNERDELREQLAAALRDKERLEGAIRQIRNLCEPDSYGVFEAEAICESVKQVADSAMSSSQPPAQEKESQK